MSEHPVYEASDDTFLLWGAIQEYFDSCAALDSVSFLDMGAGSGYIGFEAGKCACKQVTFADVNPASIALISSFIESECLPFKVIETDLFENVSGEFDIIAFNTPYLPNETGEEVHDVALHGGPEGITVAKNFLKQAKDHLTKNGKIFLLASSLGNQEKLTLYAQSLGYQWKVVAKESLFFEQLLVYEFVRNAAAFDMNSEKQVAELKELLPKTVTDSFLLHRGKRGVVFQGRYENQDVVVKVLRPGVDARNTIHLEATYLKKANERNVGPKLLLATDTYVIMQFIPGLHISTFFETVTDSARLRKVITDVCGQLRELDAVGLNKFEMTNPYKHIIITHGDLPVLVDFERMRFTARPKNITQFSQYLTGKAVLPLLQEQGVLVDVDAFKDAIRVYSKGETSIFEQFL